MQPGTVINTASFSVGGKPIHDTHPRDAMTVAEIIQHSSNIGAAKLAMQMEPSELWSMYSNVGFGQRPQIEFPGAVSGRLRPYKNWKPVDQSRLAFGYGLSASLLQMARAYTVFARDGEIVPVTMLRQEQPVAGVRVLSPQVARDVRKMLQMATETGGTATRAQALGYSVGGKTGTAHAQEGGDYLEQQAPRVVRRHGADDDPARGGGGDDRPAEPRRPFRRRRRGAGVQPGGAADAAPAQRAARSRGAAADRGAGAGTGRCRARARGRALMALTVLHDTATAVQLAAGRRSTRAVHRQPARALPAMHSSPGRALRDDGRRHVADALTAGAACCLVDDEGIDALCLRRSACRLHCPS